MIDVTKVIANAVEAGDAVHNKQGFHFKLQFVQDPQKHKTFWVKCEAPPPPPPPTGFVQVCKNGASPAVTGNFRFAVAGQTYTVPVGHCSDPIEVTPGAVHITELQRSGFALTGVTTQPSSRLVSVDLAARNAVVTVLAGNVSTETVVTFTNRAVPPPPPPRRPHGFVEICKQGTSAAVRGSFRFVMAGKTYTVPVGACTPAIRVRAGRVRITELRRFGFALAGVATQPRRRLLSVEDRTAIVKVVAGGISTQTIVTFTNRRTRVGTGRVKVCKVAGPRIAVGRAFTFQVGSRTVSVPAGPAAGGYCVLVPVRSRSA